jgi:ribosomal protein L40E
MPTLQYFPPTEEAGAIVAEIPGVRFTEVPVLAVNGPDGHLGPESAEAIMHLHMTMIDEEKTKAFWMQVAITLKEAADTPGLIRFVAITDGLSQDAIGWWRTVEHAKSFAASTVHRTAIREMNKVGFEYTHFAALWELVETRHRHVFCDACGAKTVLPADECRACGAPLADVFLIQNGAGRS